MKAPRRALAAALLLACAVSCERQGGSPQPVSGPPSRPPPTGPVVEARLAGCDAAASALPAPPADADERVEGLLETLVSGRGRMREIALEELAGLGEGLVPALQQRLTDRAREPSLRGAAAEALGRIGAVGSRAATETLLATLEGSRTALEREPWLYAQCAWQLGRLDQAWVVPRLVLCLKYEPDHETVVWIADSLAGYGLLCGLDALFVIVRDGQGEPRERAEALLVRLQGELGCADWSELARRWREGGPDLPPTPQDEAYDCEVWRTIAALAEWQLRGVDDARYVLSRLGVREAGLLGQALSDANVYVRLHAAQCLERMGPRGQAAGEALASRLDDPQVGPQAAAALGALGYEPALEPLAARLTPAFPLELRVAAARALGSVGADAPNEVAAAVRALLADGEVADLRAAAAGAQLRTARPDAPLAGLARPLELLVGLLVSGEVEPRGPEDALAAWLARRAESGDAAAQAVLEAWNAVPPEPAAQRLAARAELIRAAFGVPARQR